MKSDMKKFGGAHQTDKGARNLSPKLHHPPKMVLTGDIASPLFAHLQIKFYTLGGDPISLAGAIFGG